MAFDAFLKLDGIKGESQDYKHKGEIEVLSFSWGTAHSAPLEQHGIGMGHGLGQAKIEDFSIVKKVDSSTPLLFLYCVNGTHIKEVNFIVRKAGGEQLEYLKIKFTTVLISGYKPHGDAAYSPRDPDTGQITGKEVGGDEIP